MGTTSSPSFRPLAGLGVIQLANPAFDKENPHFRFPSPRGAWGNSTDRCEFMPIEYIKGFRPLAGLGVIQPV